MSRVSWMSASYYLMGLLMIVFFITNILDCCILWGASMRVICSTRFSVSRCLSRLDFVELFHFSVHPLQREPF